VQVHGQLLSVTHGQSPVSVTELPERSGAELAGEAAGLM
jgi:hypothetical protein